MSRGGEDFGYPNYTFGIGGVDQNEIQQMLLGFGLIDGMGRTVLYDDFSNGLGRWILVGQGGAIAPYLSGVAKAQLGHIFRAPNVVEFETGAGGIALSYMDGNFDGASIDRFGLEFGIFLQAGMPRFTLSLGMAKGGGAARTVVVDINKPAGTFNIFSGAGVVDLTAFVPNLMSSSKRLRIKAVGDYNENKYARLFVGDVSIDVSAYPLSTFIGVSADSFRCLIQSQGAAGVTKPNYLGYIRLTKDEP